MTRDPSPPVARRTIAMIVLVLVVGYAAWETKYSAWASIEQFGSASPATFTVTNEKNSSNEINRHGHDDGHEDKDSNKSDTDENRNPDDNEDNDDENYDDKGDENGNQKNGSLHDEDNMSSDDDTNNTDHEDEANTTNNYDNDGGENSSNDDGEDNDDSKEGYQGQTDLEDDGNNDAEGNESSDDNNTDQDEGGDNDENRNHEDHDGNDHEIKNGENENETSDSNNDQENRDENNHEDDHDDTGDEDDHHDENDSESNNGENDNDDEKNNDSSDESNNTGEETDGNNNQENMDTHGSSDDDSETDESEQSHNDENHDNENGSGNNDENENSTVENEADENDNEVGVFHVGYMDQEDWPHLQLSSSISNTVCDGLRQMHIMSATPPGRNAEEVRLTMLNASPLPNGGTVQEIAYHTGACDDSQVGNKLHEIYAARIITSAIGSDMKFSLACPAPKEGEEESFIRLHADYLANRESRVDDFGFSPSDLESLCAQCDVPYLGYRGGTGYNFDHHLADYAGKQIRADLQIMAGVEQEQEQEQNHQRKDSDVAMHFRCGDALSFKLGADATSLLPFHVYSQVIQSFLDEEEAGQDPEKKGDEGDTTNEGTSPLRISIVTQSFDKNKVRTADDAFVTRCKMVVEDFAAYLEDQLSPQLSKSVEITIHAGESVMETYSRLIWAQKISICGPSSFCQFPVVASMATRGYMFQMSTGIVARWTESLEMPHLRSFDVASDLQMPPLEKETSELSDEELLAWLRQPPP